MSNILEIKNLNLSIDENQALYNVNLSLEKGSTHALVGESGCGKTMTAMSVMRLLPKKAVITQGSAVFDGKNLISLKEKEMRKIRGNEIALIPQDPMTALNPLYTIGNQLVESIRIHTDLSKREALEKAKDVLNMVKIPDIECKLNYYPHEFSGGMKQRVIIAMALATKAKLIIADEPTTALDVTIQKQIMNLLDEIKKEYGTTILLISHDLALVSNYADDISVMYSGHIVEQASANEFFKNPKHPYSIALLNSLPTNSLLKLRTIEGNPPSIKENISGCKFHPRCEFCKKDLCTASVPELKDKGLGHYSACFVK